MPPMISWTRAVWRPLTALALAASFAAPLAPVDALAAQERLPATAEAAPASTVLFQTLDLDREGAQWQQAEELLARVGVPDALDLWEDAILEEAERSGDFSEADLDVLFGGEMAVAVLPSAVEHFATMAMMGFESDTLFRAEDATPMAVSADEALGVVAMLMPGDPDAAWDYVERQFAGLAAEHGVTIEERTYGDAEVLLIEPGNDPAQSGSGPDAMGDWMSGHELYGDGAFAAARAGEFIVAGKTEADVTGVIDVIDGTADSLAGSAEAQAVAAELPADALSFTYLNGQGVLDALDPEAIAMLQSMMPEMPVEAWGSQSGFAISADDPGFRFDSVTILNDAADLSAITVENDPAVATAAEQAPAGTFAFQAGRLAENAFLGAPYLLAQAVNAESSAEWADEQSMMQFPTEEEMDEEIAAAAATLEFDPRTELFDLLGDELIAFTSFPSFSFDDFGIDAVAAVSTDDPVTLAETAQKIAAWIDRSEPNTDISARRVGEDTVYVAADAETEGVPGLEFGVVADQAVIAIGGGIEALVSDPADSLADDAQFQTVMGLLPGEFYQVGYLDIGQAIDPLVMLMGVFGMMDGLGSGEDAFGAAQATPISATGDPRNIRALGAVAFQEENIMGASAILYIAEGG